MGPRLAPHVLRLLRAQRDLIADWQVAELGVAPRALQRACANGWQRHGHHVFSDRTGEPTEAQQRMIAFLETGPESMLTGRAALVEAGWTLGQDDHVDVLVPRGSRGRRRHQGLPWLRVHTPADLPGPRGSPPRTGSARATIDAAMWASTARESLTIIVSSTQHRLTSPAQLSRDLAGRTQVRHRRWIDEALLELHGGATSTAEADFLRECRRRGLPTPTMQRRRVDALGGNRRTDAEFRLPDGRLVIVEIDGVGHMQVEQWHSDLRRHNALTVATGAIALRVTGWEVRNDPDPFFSLLESLIRADVIPDAIR